MTVSRKARKEEVALAIGVHPKTVLQWGREGLPFDKRKGHGAHLFDIVEVDRWRRKHGKATHAGRPAGDGAVDPETAALNKAKLQEQVRTLRVRRQLMEGGLHDARACGARKRQQILVVRNATHALRDRMARVLEMQPRAEIRRLLGEALDAMVKGFATK